MRSPCAQSCSLAYHPISALNTFGAGATREDLEAGFVAGNGGGGGGAEGRGKGGEGRVGALDLIYVGGVEGGGEGAEGEEVGVRVGRGSVCGGWKNE